MEEHQRAPSLSLSIGVGLEGHWERLRFRVTFVDRFPETRWSTQMSQNIPTGMMNSFREASRDRSFPHQYCGSIIISLGLQGTEVKWKPAQKRKFTNHCFTQNEVSEKNRAWSQQGPEPQTKMRCFSLQTDLLQVFMAFLISPPPLPGFHYRPALAHTWTYSPQLPISTNRHNPKFSS